MKFALGMAACLLVLAAIVGWLWTGSHGSEAALPDRFGVTGEVAQGEVRTLDPSVARRVESQSQADEAEEVSQRIQAAGSQTVPFGAESEAVVIEVFVQDGDGRPVERASVRMDFTSESLGHSSTVTHIGTSTGKSAVAMRQGQAPSLAHTDASGTARFSIPEASLLTQHVQLTARGDNSIATAALGLPLSSTRLVMTLIACAHVEVNVVDSLQRPLSGAYVDIAPSSGQGSRVTNELGRAVFDNLRDGEYEFSCRDKSTGASAHQRIAVRLASRHFLELRLGSEAVARIAVAGTVVDESGVALPKQRVRIQVDVEKEVALVTNEQGEFSHSCAEGAEVGLKIGSGLWEDDFEPQPLRVPFGTSDVRLRRTRQIEHFALEMICLDASTGEPIPGNWASGSRYRVTAPTDRANFNFDGKGRRSLSFKARDDWRVTINCLGYESEDLAIADAMLPSPNGFALTLRMRRAANYQKLKDAGDLENN
jgi:protocatechuate 3,4-dioxygenase beta subunit